MKKPSLIVQSIICSLVGVIVLNSTMLGALLAQVPPNPPGRFGPYIGATIALAAISLLLIRWQNKAGYICSIIVGIMCSISMGPIKLIREPNPIHLYPVIILGFIISIVLIVSPLITWKTGIETA